MILFVDDDTEAALALIRSLERRTNDFNFKHAENAERALEIFNKERPDVAVVDLTLDPAQGPESGFSLIRQFQELDSFTRILVLTGHGAEEIGVKALQCGAASFLTKPIDTDHLLALVKDCVSYVNLKRHHEELCQREAVREIKGLSTRSPQMKKIIESVAYAGTNSQALLITGETGTGKGVIAQIIHDTGNRCKGPFIRVQPTFGSNDLITSELFGHEKGAFTGAVEARRGLIEEANGGTLFIDEIDELPNETQVLLLNVLQEKKFRRLGSNKELHSDFRLITASNSHNLESKLREDFYHRISHFQINLPPLRERLEDISVLAKKFLREIVTRENLAVQDLSDSASAKLLSYSWPGNIRELQAVIEGALYRANFYERRFVEAEDIELQRKSSNGASSGKSFREKVQDFELELINSALTKCDNNQVQAAESLKVDRSTLRRVLSRAR